MNPTPLFFFLLVTVRLSLSLTLSFLVASCSHPAFKALQHVYHERQQTASAAGIQPQPTMDMTNLAGGVVLKKNRLAFPCSARRHSHLPASGNSSDGEKSAAPPSDTSSSVDAVTASLVEAAGNVTPPGSEGEEIGATAVDLAKGISFETPKPKDGEVEEDGDGSEAKKLRVILYTVLSLVPFLLLIPFLGGRDLVPLDPNQM